MSGGHTTALLIFVVEDQELLRMETLDLLHEAGFEILETATADAAFEAMRSRWRDVRVLLTGVQMPGLIDGVDLAHEVHRCWPDVLLMVTSGDVDLTDKDLPDEGSSSLSPTVPRP